jgi:O-antigen ligase
VLGYCALQLSAGPGNKFVPFGIEAFAFNNNRDTSDPRLIGPFSTPGAMAGYFTLMLVMCVSELIHAQGRRRLLIQAIIGLNVLGLLATGNRAGMLVVLAVFPVLMFVFRRELGPKRIAQYSIGGVAVLLIAFAVAVSFTNFGNMLTRMEGVTETENGVPETRAGTWPVAVEKIKRHPWFGEGPYFLTIEQAENMDIFLHRFDESGAVTTTYDAYPHSLYLFLLRTVGVFGLVAILWFFVQAWRQLQRATKSVPLDRYASAILRGGVVAIPAFLVAQITLEFNRYATLDYAHFVFALVGLLVGMSDRALGAVAEASSDKLAKKSPHSTPLAA